MPKPHVPSWVTDGWYSNNQALQDLAVHRFLTYPVTDPTERAMSRAAVRLRANPRALDETPNLIREAVALREFAKIPTFACVSCDKFAFPKADTRCYWCRRG